MFLEYQVGVSGENALKNSIRGIEQEAISQERRASSREAGHARSRVRLTERSAQQMAAAEEKANQRAIAKREKDEERARLRKIREEGKAADKIRRYEERQLNQFFMARHRAEEGARRREERAARQAVITRQRTAASISRGAGRVFSGAAGSIAGGIGTIAGLGGIGVSLLAGNAVRTQMDEQALATQLANQASSKADPQLRDNLLKEAQGIRGFTGGEALSAMSEFVAKTGDLEAARGIMSDLGTLALATGSDLTDLGATAGHAFNVLKDQIADPIQLVAEMKSLMGTLAQQGAMGAVEIRDLAGEFGKLGAATRAFEGGAPSLLRGMGAFAQLALARGGASTSADAATAAARLANDIVVNQKKFKGLGVGVKSKVDPTKLRDPMEIILDVLDKTKGDVVKTTGLFGQESGKIFKGVAATYSEAEKKQKGSGRAAANAEYMRFMTATMSEEDIQGKANLRLQDPDQQWKDLMRDFNSEVGSKLIPVVQELIPHLRDLIGPIGELTIDAIDLAKVIADNPLKSLGAVVAGFMVKELAAVGMSKLIENSITSLLSRLGGGGGPSVDIPLGGGLGGGAGGAAKAGRLARIGGGLRTAGVFGAIAATAFTLPYLASSMYNQSDAAQEKQKKNAKAGQDFYGVGVYSGSVGKGYQQDLVDPRFSGAIDGVVSAAPRGPVQAPASFDVSKMEALTQKQAQAAERQVQAAAQFERAVRDINRNPGGGVNQSRVMPILLRDQ